MTLFLDQVDVSSRLVKDLASRLQDPDYVEKTMLSSPASISAWDPLSLSHGYSGLLLLFATLDQIYPEEGWDQTSHRYVIKIKQIIEGQGVSNFSLFKGLAGACFAIQQASKGKSRYTKMLTSLNEFLCKEIEKEYFVPLREKMALKLPAKAEWIDVMFGIVGIGAYLLKNIESSYMLESLKEILQFCIALTEDIEISAYKVSGWYQPRHYQFIEEDKRLYPQGNFNLGMAHGISGVLAFLAIAQLHGVTIQGQHRAMQKISDWLVAKREEKEGRFFWADRISFEEEVKKEEKVSSHYIMDAWCYGTAGVARALFLAGTAFQDRSLQEVASTSFHSLFSSPFKDSFSSPTFCHGFSGLLTLTHLMAKETKSSFLEQKIYDIREILLGFYRADSPFGFRDVEPLLKTRFTLRTDKKKADPSKWREVDKAGILDGTAGILLSLLGSVTHSTSWAFPFLVEGTL